MEAIYAQGIEIGELAEITGCSLELLRVRAQRLALLQVIDENGGIFSRGQAEASRQVQPLPPTLQPPVEEIRYNLR
jgi:hypothetical protein